MAFSEAEDPDTDNRIAATCSSCTYEFILKPLPNLLNSNSTRQNIISSDTEFIQSFIADAEEEVTRCSDEVWRLRAIIERVEKRQSKLSHDISIHQSFIAPIRRLLLALIFSFFCTVDFWDCKPFRSKKGKGSVFREPFILATVCSYWRSIAVTTPSLWSTIMVAASDDMGLSREKYEADDDSAEEFDEESKTFPEDVLNVALERSAQHPLQLWIERFDDLYWPSIFRTKLRQVSSNDDGGSMVPLQWLATAPNVRTLILHDLEEAGARFWDHLPFQSTRFLFIQQSPFADAITTLSRFPNLASSGLMCEFSNAEGKFSWTSAQTLHHLDANIQCLERRCRSASDEAKECYCFDNVLSNLTLPGLKSLRLQGDSHHEDIFWSQTHFIDFIDRSAIKETLSSLSLHNIGRLDNVQLRDVFQSLPFLTSLTVSAFDARVIISVSILQQLSTASLLPRLKFLEIEIRDTVEAIEAVASLVQARTPPRGRLEEIVMRMVEISAETAKKLENAIGSFTETRHSILRAHLCTCDSSFDDWMNEIRRV
ncbi:hypothetical protein C8J56DRAFT_1165262 [Mycena floridula]|nr:hypothetical protein C8J56DRAFT_1165262 [Mycena floridula]